MFKFLLFFILAVGTVFGIPALRAKVMPPLEPVLSKLGIGERLSNPIKKRTANNEIRVLLQKLAEDISEKKEPPSPLGFRGWVRANTRLEKRGLDPWGRAYWLSRSPNQLTVGSNGPDQKRDTPDDVRISVPYQ